MLALLLPAWFAGAPLAAAAAVPSPSLALEQAIYLADTIGDTEQALALLDGIVRSGGEAVPPVRAEAIARSALLLLQAGRTNEAVDRARLLQAETLPAAASWQAWARTFLASATRLPLRPAPWPQDEYLTYRVTSLNGDHFGYHVSWAGAGTHDQQTVCAVRSWLNLSRFNQIQQASLLATPVADGFQPLALQAKTHIADTYTAAYQHAAQSLVIASDGAQARTLPLPQGRPLFDVEQLLYLPRLLPGEPQRTYTVLTAITGGLFGETTITSRGREQIAHAGGTIMAEHWEARVQVTDMALQTYHIWLRPDGDRHILRVEGDMYAMHLESATLRPAMQPLRRPVPAFPFHYTVPQDWVSHARNPDDAALRVELLSADGHGLAVWLVSRNREDNPDPAATLQADLTRLRQLLPEFTVLADAPADTRPVADKPTAAAAATFMERGRRVREQRYYFQHDNRIQWIVLRAPEASWRRYWNSMEAFIDSIRLDPEDAP
jgi:hypothetical protein